MQGADVLSQNMPKQHLYTNNSNMLGPLFSVFL